MAGPRGAASARVDGRVPTPTNGLVSALSTDDRRLLQAALEPVPLLPGSVLCMCGEEPRYAYFPTRGVVALVGMTSDGDSVQVGLVGTDGVVGLPTVLQVSPSPYELTVPVAGEALRIRVAQLLSATRRSAGLQQVLFTYAHAHLVAVTQATLCLRFHPARARVSSWLLTVADGVRSDAIGITQEALARLLGIPRSTVSVAMTRLQDVGAIRLRHGRVQILARGRLQATACACYVPPLSHHARVAR